MPATPEPAVDHLDVAILEVLQKDGRAPFSSIARELDLPESTIRQRTKKLLDAGIVSIVATGDPLKLGIPVDAIHVVRIDPLAVDRVVAELSAMADVRYVAVTLGGRALIVESLHLSMEAYHAFLAQDLPAIAGIKEVETHQIVDNRMSVWDWRAWLRVAEPRAAGNADPRKAPTKEAKEPS